MKDVASHTVAFLLGVALMFVAALIAMGYLDSPVLPPVEVACPTPEFSLTEMDCSMTALTSFTCTAVTGPVLIPENDLP